jgi:hypothetical protein
MGGTAEKAKANATSIAVAWQNKIDYLPDPARNGAEGPGLAGQVFFFGPRYEPALADGTLTIDLYDETPRPPGVPANKPERWQYKKDVLKEMRTMDERFGPNYLIFLPWPAYRPDTTRVRLTVRYDPEHGYPQYAPEARLLLDATVTADGQSGGLSSRGPRATVVTTLEPPPIPRGVTTAVGPPPPTTGIGPGLGTMRMTRQNRELSVPSGAEKLASDPLAEPARAVNPAVTAPPSTAPVTVYPRQP